jgi:hypothetical protein
VVAPAIIETLLDELSRSSRQDVARNAFTGLNARWNAGPGALPGFTALDTTLLLLPWVTVSVVDG